MPVEIAIGFTFLAVYAMVANILVQTRRAQ
jgi:hypothetical protein